MTYRAPALQLGIINLVFLTLLLCTYAYMELANIPVSKMTYTVMQLTAFINLVTIAVVGSFIYYLESKPDKPWEES